MYYLKNATITATINVPFISAFRPEEYCKGSKRKYTTCNIQASILRFMIIVRTFNEEQ